MPGVPGAASGRALSAGATFVIGAGLGLYQLTSLVLGPVSNRQLDFSLTIPTLEGQDLSEPPAPTFTLVLGTRATPATHPTQVSPSPRVVSPIISASSPLRSPSPVAGEGRGGGSQPAGKKHHADH